MSGGSPPPMDDCPADPPDGLSVLCHDESVARHAILTEYLQGFAAILHQRVAYEDEAGLVRLVVAMKVDPRHGNRPIQVTLKVPQDLEYEQLHGLVCQRLGQPVLLTFTAPDKGPPATHGTIRRLLTMDNVAEF
eukprot:RCo050416